MDTSSAAKITQSFFSNFFSVRAWISRIKTQAKRYLLVKTLLGRVRHLPNIVNGDNSKVAAAERQAVNSVIQGTASDLIKLAMVICNQYLADQNHILSSRDEGQNRAYTLRMVMQIHDELIFEVPADLGYIQQFTERLRDIMEREIVQRLHLQVPLVANISVGEKWGKMTPWPPNTTDGTVI